MGDSFDAPPFLYHLHVGVGWQDVPLDNKPLDNNFIKIM